MFDATQAGNDRKQAIIDEEKAREEALRKQREKERKEIEEKEKKVREARDRTERERREKAMKERKEKEEKEKERKEGEKKTVAKPIAKSKVTKVGGYPICFHIIYPPLFRNSFVPPPPLVRRSGIRCCRSDWPGLCLFLSTLVCCQPTELFFFCFMHFPILPPPPRSFPLGSG